MLHPRNARTGVATVGTVASERGTRKIELTKREKLIIIPTRSSNVTVVQHESKFENLLETE